MATTMVPEAPATRPAPRSPGDTRFVTIRANLMPDEVVIARRTEALRRQIVLALLVVLGLLIAWFTLSWWGTHNSNADLDAANQRQVALTGQQKEFNELVQAQNEAATVQTQLQRLMVGDLSWKQMLTKLRSTAPAGVGLTSVTGTITSGAAAAAGGATSQTSAIGVLNQSGKVAAGSMTLAGTSRDQKSIAGYVDQLSRVKGLAAPYIASFSGDRGSVTFTINVVVTTDALGGRYAVAPTTTGGK